MIAPDDMEIPLPEIKQRIHDQFHQSWHNSLIESSKLKLYRRYKQTLELEPYIDSVHVLKYKRILSQFRSSSHTLAIETGRYDNTHRGG